MLPEISINVEWDNGLAEGFPSKEAADRFIEKVFFFSLIFLLIILFSVFILSFTNISTMLSKLLKCFHIFLLKYELHEQIFISKLFILKRFCCLSQHSSQKFPITAFLPQIIHNLFIYKNTSLSIYTIRLA